MFDVAFVLEIVCSSCSHRRKNTHPGRLGKGREECSAGFEQLAGEQGDATWGWALPDVCRALRQTSPSKKRKHVTAASWAVSRGPPAVGIRRGSTWEQGRLFEGRLSWAIGWSQLCVCSFVWLFCLQTLWEDFPRVLLVCLSNHYFSFFSSFTAFLSPPFLSPSFLLFLPSTSLIASRLC